MITTLKEIEEENQRGGTYFLGRVLDYEGKNIILALGQ